MKKFSTATLALVTALASTSALFVAPTAHAAKKKASCEFKTNAPDSHKVVRGDTLWGISGKFLDHPWCWPEVWGLNKAQIRDPHWIYPGQIVYFDRVNKRLRLGNPSGVGGLPNVRLSPHARIEGIGLDAIPTIPASEIEPFLSQPLIVEESELSTTPYIAATQEGHVFLGKGDKAYVRGDLKSGTSFQAFRPGKPLKDPETNAIIGYEAAYLGTVKLQREAKFPEEAHIFTVVSTKEEMGKGDRLVPVVPTPIMNYVPHAPEMDVQARIVSIYGGVAHAGQNQIVAINRGVAHGVDVGTVLDLYRHGMTLPDPEDKKKTFRIPDEKYGTLFIFRVFNNIAYGLIMQVTDTVQVGDVARSPE